MPYLRRASPYLLALGMLGAGMLHFLKPAPYDGLIPGWLPGSARAWVYGSGVVELGCGVLLLPARTRRLGATATALLFVAVFPGNVEMAVHPGDTPRWLALARLPLQIPLVLWALQVRRASARGSRTGSAARG